MIAQRQSESERHIEAEINRASGKATQDEFAAICGCDQAQISRKLARILSGDSAWLEVLRADQLLRLASTDRRIGDAVVVALTNRPAPRGQSRDLPIDVQQEIERSSALVLAWVAAKADGRLTRDEIDGLLMAADGLRETCDHLIRDLRAARSEAPLS